MHINVPSNYKKQLMAKEYKQVKRNFFKGKMKSTLF